MNTQLKIARAIVLPVILIILNLTLANSLGISPAFKTIYFRPNETVILGFEIINSEGNSFEVGLESYGDIKDYMFFENPKLQVNASDYSIPFRVILRLPSEMQPGIRTGTIKITPSFGPGGEQSLAAFVAPQIPIRIKVPYPFKYADVSAIFLTVDEGTPLPIFIEFDNMGSEDIESAGGIVEIYDPEGLLLANVSAPGVSVLRGNLGKTQAQPPPVLRRGMYNAIVKASYDRIDKNISTNFSVGEPLIKVQELMIKNLARNQVNRIVFKVHNEWNTELSAGGFLELNNKQEELPNFNIGKDQEKEIIGFFDTTGLGDGEYAIKITLAYANQVRTEIFPVTIGGKAAKPEALLTTPVIIMLVILIILIAALAAVLIIKKKKKERA